MESRNGNKREGLNIGIPKDSYGSQKGDSDRVLRDPRDEKRECPRPYGVPSRIPRESLGNTRHSLGIPTVGIHKEDIIYNGDPRDASRSHNVDSKK